MSDAANQPVIAVVTPTYNRATLISAALDSVIAQTIDMPVEIAVVDDGSTDNTAAVMQPYLETHGKPGGKIHITYTQLNKQGVVTARNTAIARTTAPYIAFLDSDDYWQPDKLAKQLAILQAQPDVGLVHTSFRYVNEASEITDDGPQRLDNPLTGDCLDTLLHEFLVLFSSVMVRRSIVDQAAAAEEHGQPFDNRWTNSQDYDLVLRCARLSKLAYIAEPLTMYRMHGSHGAMGNLARAFGFHCRVQIDFVRRYGSAIGIDDAEIKRRVAKFLGGRAESAFWQRQFETSRKLCDLARELGADDGRFAAIRRKASRPVWIYRMKDAVDRLFGRKATKT
ncbi:MAG: glycosyltransferase [Phycisphaeraceae bacterium]